ncbi:MAG: PEGA domain-containing protein [Polyangiaceae bacterium]|jgi:tetratricopeptide (TPR) repeat protein
MKIPSRPVRIVVGIITLLVTALFASSAGADDGASVRDAAKHFQRGVTLYGEADYRAALVEFKRAYATAPNVAVLYNVGETEYQLQDYASALTTFERYLGEATASESHRGEVESTLEILRARVGHLTITTTPPGADITLDDTAVGRTPYDKALLVSIGRRKVVASMAGRSPVSRYVDVAADDNVSVTLVLSAESTASTIAVPQAPAPKVEPESTGNTGATLRTIGWITTGASAVGAVTFGLLAMKASSNLEAARASYPTTSATLNGDASLTTTYSILADSLTAAAILIGGVTLYSTLSSSAPTASKRGSAGATRVSLGPGSVRFEMTF